MRGLGDEVGEGSAWGDRGIRRLAGGSLAFIGPLTRGDATHTTRAPQSAPIRVSSLSLTRRLTQSC
jgi:hypothetical protein